MANDVLGKELEVGQTVLYGMGKTSKLYKGKVFKVCPKQVIINDEFGQRKYHEGVVIINE